MLLVLLYFVGSLWVAHSSLYMQGLILVAAAFAVVALGLDLVIGVTGMFSLGHAGLLGCAAYLTAVIWTHFGVNIFWLLPVAIAGSAFCGFILGAASARVGGLQFAIVTFIFTLVLTTVVSNLGITGGADGLLGPTSPEWPSSLRWLGSTTSWIVMLVLLAGITVTWSIRRSPLYPVLLGVRDADRFAEAAGARLAAVKIGIFTLSGALVGMAGWAFSLLGAVSPDEFTWIQSVNMLIMVLLGGFNTALGPIVGAALVSIVPAAVGLQSYVDDVIEGLVILVVVLVLPKGIVGSAVILYRRIRNRVLRRGERRVGMRSISDDLALNVVYDSADEGHNRVSRTHEASEGALAVRCTDVSFRYPSGAIHALSHVDFCVQAGSIHGLIGPNGSGKSTLIDVISGRLRTQGGSVVVNSELIDGRPDRRAALGFMRTFQAATLVNEMSGVSNVLVGAYTRLRRVSVRAPLWVVLPGTRADFAWLRGEADAALRAVGVGGQGHNAIADVPQAVRQLVQLAAVCVARPTTLVLDEPLAGLSVGEVEHVQRVLRELQRLGVTVIIVEHQTQFVFEVCDEVTVLSSGQVVMTGDAATVRRDEKVREVYLGL